MHNFSLGSPSEHSSVNTDHTPTPSKLRANPFLPPTLSQRQDFNFVQEHFRVQPLQSPNSSLWSATSPQSTSTSTTPLRTNQTSSSNTSYTKHNKPRKNIFRRHSSDITHITDHNDNDKPSQVNIDTNYKHYNTTIRRTDKELQLRTKDSPPMKQKPPLPERKYKPEPLKIEPLETITENKLPIQPPQLNTPPPAYQCLGNNVSFNTPQTKSLPTPHITPIPSAPNIQQQPSTFQGSSYEPPLGISKTTPYEIPQPSSTSTYQQNLIPSVKLIEIQNPHL